MTKHKLVGMVASLCLALPIALPAVAQDKTLVIAHNRVLVANWEMYSDDSYLGADIGCMETLIRVDPDMQLYPWLATEWKQTGDLTWEFTLREGVRFQDGTPMTAETVAGSLNHLLGRPVPARAFSTKFVDKIEATGPMTVVITTKAPDVLLPGRLTSPPTSILAPSAFQGEVTNPINACTGPFTITAFDAKTTVDAVANPDYWGGAPKLAGTQLRFIPDATTRAALIRSGEAQLAILLPSSSVAQIESTPGVTLNTLAAPRMTELLINTKKPPFDNPKVREAMRMVIDTAGISEAVFEGFAPPTASPLRATEPWAPKDAPVLPPDVEKAKALLAEAGVDLTGQTFNLDVYTSKSELRPVAEIIQAGLAEIGITVNVNLQEYAVIEPRLMSGDFDLAMMSRGYLVDAPEPLAYFGADYACGGGFNISQYCNPDFDAKLAAIGAEGDPAKRVAGYSELAQFLYDEALTVFIVNEPQFNATVEGISGYVPHPLNYYLVSSDTELK